MASLGPGATRRRRPLPVGRWLAGSAKVQDAPEGSASRRWHADVAQLVEHHLAKVRVAGSNPVVRSETTHPLGGAVTELAVEWPRGEATACKAVYTGSNPVSTSERSRQSPQRAARAISSVGERFLDTEEVTSSILVSPTTKPQVTGLGLHHFVPDGIPAVWFPARPRSTGVPIRAAPTCATRGGSARKSSRRTRTPGRTPAAWARTWRSVSSGSATGSTVITPPARMLAMYAPGGPEAAFIEYGTLVEPTDGEPAGPA